MKEIGSRVGSILFIVFFFASSTVMMIIAILIRVVTGPFDKRLTASHWFSCLWASIYIWTMPAWSVKVSGREKVDRDKTYVMVSNHQSLVDILVGFHLFTHFKWVAKIELAKVPFIGLNMRLNNYVFLKRGDRKSIIEMMRECEAHIKKGSSVYIYPEGTRSETGEMRAFKSGAFALAKRTNTPILPIAIIGTKDALPKNSYTIRGWHKIEIAILDEIPLETVEKLEAKDLAEIARDQIEGYLSKSNE